MVPSKSCQNRASFLHFMSILLLGITTNTLASKKQPEIYPAVIDDLTPEAKHTPSLPHPKRTLHKTENYIFESVPPEQIEGISQRLKLIDQLLRKYGRAYDYRIHTIKELENILSELDAKATSEI